MKEFQVFSHPTLKPQAVKVGLCWPALIGGPWMLVSRLWGWFFLYAIVFSGLSVVEKSIDTITDNDQLVVYRFLMLVAYSLLVFIPVFRGNYWRARNLIHRGYSICTTVDADDIDAAIRIAGRELGTNDANLRVT